MERAIPFTFAHTHPFCVIFKLWSVLEILREMERVQGVKERKCRKEIGAKEREQKKRTGKEKAQSPEL